MFLFAATTLQHGKRPAHLLEVDFIPLTDKGVPKT